MTELPRWARRTMNVARLDLLRWRRQKMALVATLVFPVLVASLMATALGRDPGITTRWAVVDEDGGPAAAAFFETMAAHPELSEVVRLHPTDREDGARALRRHEVSAVVVLPGGLSESIAAGDPARLIVDTRTTDEPGSDIARLVADQFWVRAWAAGHEIAHGGEAFGEGPWPLEVSMTSTTGRELDPATHYGPAVGVFMLLMVFSFAIENQALDRASGLNDRISSAGVPTSTVVLGRSLAAGFLGLLTLTVTAAVMAFGFGKSWGDPAPVAGLIVAVVVCYVGIAALLAGQVRTTAQPQVVTVTVGLLLALGSGSLTPPTADLPAIAPFLPTTHAVEGFAEAAVGGAELGDVAGQISLLVASGAVMLVLALVLERRAA